MIHNHLVFKVHVSWKSLWVYDMFNSLLWGRGSQEFVTEKYSKVLWHFFVPIITIGTIFCVTIKVISCWTWLDFTAVTRVIFLIWLLQEYIAYNGIKLKIKNLSQIRHYYDRKNLLVWFDTIFKEADQTIRSTFNFKIWFWAINCYILKKNSTQFWHFLYFFAKIFFSRRLK